MFKTRTLIYLNKIFSYLPKSRKRELISLFPLAVLGGISEIIVIASLSRLFNFLVDKPREPLPFFSDLFNFDPKYKILILLSIFILTNWFSSIVKILLRAKQLRLKATIWRDLSELALKNLISKQYEFFLKNNNSNLSASVLVNINSVSDIVVLPVLQIISGSFIILFVSFAVLVIAKAKALFLILGLLLAYLFISLAIIPNIREGNRKRIELEIKSNNILTEALKSIVDVKLTNAENYFKEKYRNTGRDVIPSIWKGEALPDFPRTIIEPLGITFIFMIGIFPLILTSDISLISEAIPFLAIIAAASLKLTPPLQDTFKGYNSIRGGLPDLKETIKLIELEKNSTSITLKEDNEEQRKPKFIYPQKNISLKNISYKYPSSESNVIENLTLNIKIGSKVAFVGSTGSGKTTTANLLLQLLKPQKGRLLLDDNPINEREIRIWQRNCAYVTQNFYLNNSTILENVAFAKDLKEIKRNDVWKALESAKLKDLVETLPKGLNSGVGENGIKLSGGQRQRLALARAFYRKSRFLVLDEATSALDNKTESEVMNSIDLVSNKCTLIIIAHRLSTVMNADKIYEFNSGKIIHSGTFDELCKVSESFKDLSLLEKKILRA